MSRSVQWRRTVSDACNWHQTQALEATIYILRQTGPTGFLLKEEGETKNVKVFLGDPHTCTCPVFKKERDLCKHICWLLLRKFRLSINDPLSWQLGLVEREVNEILRGRVTADRSRPRQNPATKKLETLDGRNVVEQREIAEDDVCPICQDELLSKKLPVTYCKFGCGNTIHIKCMQVWAEHQQKTSQDGKIKCPMCREDFGPLDLLKTEMRNAGASSRPAPGIRMDRHIGIACSHCSVAPIEGKCYRCTVCPTFNMCQRCFNLPVHMNHAFQFRHKRNQRWRSAPRSIGSNLPPALVNDLMHREISEDDYDVLLQLERNSQEELSNLTEDHIQSIPKERVREGGPLLAPGSQCRICLRGFVVGQQVRKLPCRHRFHLDCIDSWLLHSHPTCPIDGLMAVTCPPPASTTTGAQGTVLSSRTSGHEQEQVQANNPLMGNLTLTAFGIPVSTTRLSDTPAGGSRTQQRHLGQRLHHTPPTGAGLELLGLRVGGDPTPSQQNEDADERVPGQRLMQQAIRHRERLSQQLGTMQRENSQGSQGSNSDQLLTPGSLIQFLQSEALTSALDDSAFMDNRRPSAGSASSITSDTGPRSRHPHQVTQVRGRHQVTRPSLRQRSNSLERAVPSIQSASREMRDLFLGNNPSLQPAVAENVAYQRPPVAPRARGRVFKSVFQNHLSHLANVPASRLADMRLDGNAVEGNGSTGHHADI